MGVAEDLPGVVLDDEGLHAVGGGDVELGAGDAGAPEVGGGGVELADGQQEAAIEDGLGVGEPGVAVRGLSSIVSGEIRKVEWKGNNTIRAYSIRYFATINVKSSFQTWHNGSEETYHSSTRKDFRKSGNLEALH